MKELHSFLELAVKLAEVAVAEHEADKHALHKVARIVEKRAKEKIGEYQDQAGPFAGWAELAEATKEDRVRQGFPEDEPLLRTGDMRDSIEHQVHGNTAEIGSDSDIAVYQELGTSKIPPRSFLGGAAFEKLEEIGRICGEHAVAALTGEQVHNGRMEIEEAMTEAYKVGITVALTNKVSQGLLLIQRDLKKTDVQAAALHATMTRISKLAVSGAILGGVGYAGFRLLERAVKPAEEYAHQLNIMNMAGMKQAEIAESIALAWKTSHDIMTTNPTGNLGAILDIRNAVGAKSLAEVKELLPMVSKIQTVLAASSESALSKNAQNIAFSMVKALDIIGAVSNPVELHKQFGMMSKAVIESNGKVTPQMFQSVFQYARQGKFDMSDEFKYEILPTLMLEAASGKGGGGGGSKGVGPMIAAMYRITNQGYVNKKSFAEWKNLGLMNPGSDLKTTTVGTTAGPVKGAQLAASNSFKWVNEVLVPAIKAKYGDNISDQFIRQEINTLMRGNQLAASLAVEFFTKQQNFLRDQKFIRGAMDYEDAFKAAMKDDPATARAAAAQQWETLETLIGLRIIPYLLPALHKLATGLKELTEWGERNPHILSALIYGFAGLSAALMFSGAVLTLKAAFIGIRAAMLFVPAVQALIYPLTQLAGLFPTLGAASGTALAALAPLSAALLGIAAAAGLIVYHKQIADKIDEYAPWAGDALLAARDTFTGPSAANGNRGFTPPPSNSQPIQVNSTVNLDGRPIAQAVTTHQTDAANGPATGPNSADNRQLFLQSGY